MRRKTLFIMLVMILIIFPSVASAEDDENEDEGDELDLSGEVDVDHLHFSAPDNSYILAGSIEITNDSESDIEEELYVVIDFPEGAGPEFSEVKPIKIGEIKAEKTIDQDFEMFISRSEMGEDREATFYVATKEDKKLVEIADLDGEVDLSVMENTYSEIDAELNGSLIEQNDGYLLNVRVEGQNHSIYPIEEDDDIFIAFQLPYNLNVNMEEAPEHVYKTSAGDSGEVIAIKFEAEDESDFTVEYDLPLVGELKESGLDNWNESMILLQQISSDIQEFVPAGNIDGEVKIDFTVLLDDDEENEENEEDNVNEEEENEEENEPKEKESSFFNISFFVGVFAGISVTFLFVAVYWLIRRT